MQRRDFLKYSVAGLAAVSLPGFLSQACKKQADRYSVVILGDTHYDDPDPLRYHKGYSDPIPARNKAAALDIMEKDSAVLRAQIENLDRVIWEYTIDGANLTMKDTDTGSILTYTKK